MNIFIYTFSQLWDLEKHMKNNHTVDPLALNLEHKCQDCDFQVDSEEDLIKHVNKCHKYKCDICGKGFKILAHVKRHVDSVHKQIKFECTHCNKSFTQEYRLKTHIKTIHV